MTKDEARLISLWSSVFLGTLRDFCLMRMDEDKENSGCIHFALSVAVEALRTALIKTYPEEHQKVIEAAAIKLITPETPATSTKVN